MKINRQWLDLGLDALPEARAQRIRLFRSLIESASRMRVLLDRTLAPSGVTMQQAAMLQMIEAQAGPPTISDVADVMGMTHQNVKQIARALQTKGFLEIVTDPTDRRARRLVLTQHHYRFWKDRNPTDFPIVEAWTAALSDEEVGTLLRLLRKLRAARKVLQEQRAGDYEGNDAISG